MARFLDTTVTKFLEEAEDGIAVTKYLHDAYNDISVTKFLDAEDGIAVTKYLDAEDGIAVTKYLDAPEDGIAVTKYLSGTPTYNTYPGNTDVNKNRNVNMTIIQFLEDYMHEHPDHMLHDAPNDISVTKFLQQNANVTQSET